jgi:hypothetical protein
MHKEMKAMFGLVPSMLKPFRILLWSWNGTSSKGSRSHNHLP